jgi:hypothetical protein
MERSPFLQRLVRELEARQQKNSRHSLRAFASFLGTDHSTLSQILRNKRRLATRQVRSWGKKLGMTAEEISVCVAAEHVPSSFATHRQEQLRHWTAEATAIVSDLTHWQILRLASSANFQPDCRWIAERVGVHVDQINVALSRLLRLRLIEIATSGAWKDVAGFGQYSEASFKKHALIRVRQLAAADGIELQPSPTH